MLNAETITFMNTGNDVNQILSHTASPKLEVPKETNTEGSKETKPSVSTHIPDKVDTALVKDPVPPSQIPIKESQNVFIKQNTFVSNPHVGTDKEKLLVTFDKQLHKFSFYDYRNSLLGSFNVNQLIKYIGTQWDNEYAKTFMMDTDIGVTIDLIQSLLATVEVDKDTKRIIIKFKSHLESPFMGNIDMLIKLNNSLHDFEIKHLDNELAKIDNLKTRKYIRIIIKQFIYLMLNHTLKIINLLSDEIKHDSSKKELKETLLKYSAGLTHRISSFVMDQLANQIEQVKQLNDNFSKLCEVRHIMVQKLTTFNEKIDKQTERIDLVLNKLGGGSHYESSNISSNDTSTYTSSVPVKKRLTKISTSTEEDSDNEESSVFSVSSLFNKSDSSNGFNSNNSESGSEESSRTSKLTSEHSESEISDTKSQISAVYNL